MVFVTGDCHGNYQRFSAEQFPEQKELTRDDVVIVCGDFGIWNDDNGERYWLNWLNDKPFTTVFVDGNHENFDRLYSDEFPIVDFHGGRAHRIRENIFHLLRGYVFEFGGKTFWCFGGASSHDVQDGILDREDFDSDDEFRFVVGRMRRYGKMFRINHTSWWEQELPSEEEMRFGLETLSKNEKRVDYIISHCAPQDVASCMGFIDSDILTRYFNSVARSAEFKRWHFGHYHTEQSVWGKFVCHYTDIERII